MSHLPLIYQVRARQLPHQIYNFKSNSNHTKPFPFKMANDQLIRAPMCIPETNSFDTFTLFPKLPAELRVKVWEFSFVPHRVIMMGAGHRPQRSQITGAHLLVNFEARQVFLEHYARCFHNLGQKAVYFNFSIDTLCVQSALKGLQKLVKQYPEAMSQIQWIDVKAQTRDSTNPEWSRMNLSALTACKKITVRFNLGTNYRRPYDGDWGDDHLTGTFDHLESCLRENPGPKLAVVLQSYCSHPNWSYSRDHPHDTYLEMSQDLSHGRFGVFKTGNLLEERDIDWVEQGKPWEYIEDAFYDFLDATQGEPQPPRPMPEWIVEQPETVPPPQQVIQQVAPAVVWPSGLSWIGSVFRCFL